MKNKTETSSRRVRAKRSNAIDVRDDDHSLENRMLTADILGTRRATPAPNPPSAPKLESTDALGMFLAHKAKSEANFETPPSSPPTQNCKGNVFAKRFRKDEDDDNQNVSPTRPVPTPTAFRL